MSTPACLLHLHQQRSATPQVGNPRAARLRAWGLGESVSHASVPTSQGFSATRPDLETDRNQMTPYSSCKCLLTSHDVPSSGLDVGDPELTPSLSGPQDAQDQGEGFKQAKKTPLCESKHFARQTPGRWVHEQQQSGDGHWPSVTPSRACSSLTFSVQVFSPPTNINTTGPSREPQISQECL